MHQHRHVGVYALIINTNHLLLIKKGRGPYTGMLDMPGGRIEFGETPEQTLLREVFEETRLRVTSHRILCSISARFLHSHHGEPEDFHHIGIIYTTSVDRPRVAIDGGDGHDSLGALWLPLDTLHRHPVTPLTLQALTYVPNNFTRFSP